MHHIIRPASFARDLTVRKERHMASFVIYADKGGEYRWKLVADNGQTTATSGESFASKSNAIRAAEGVRDSAAKADIKEE
jgi:uncharacterized protein YegP (UPF0339 family)